MAFICRKKNDVPIEERATCHIVQTCPIFPPWYPIDTKQLSPTRLDIEVVREANGVVVLTKRIHHTRETLPWSLKQGTVADLTVETIGTTNTLGLATNREHYE